MAVPIVMPRLGDFMMEGTVTTLEENGYGVAWHSYPMPHSVSPQEIADIGDWLRALV